MRRLRRMGIAGAVVASVALAMPVVVVGAAGAAGSTGAPVAPRVDSFPSAGSHLVPGLAPDPLRVPGGTSPNLGRPSSTISHSLNWSGKVDTGTKFTQVSGEWTVPAVKPASTPQLMSSWIGIGGVNGNNRLIQTGTISVTTGGTTTYVAYFELLPASPVLIGGVAPGDLMRATITQNSATTWTIFIEDVTHLTTGDIFTQRVTYTAGTATTAEWIAERPTLLTLTFPTTPFLATLGDFGTVRFTHMQANRGRPSATSTVSLAMVDTPPNTTRLLAYPGPTTPTTTGSFTDFYVSPPSVTGVSPSEGPASGGTSVTITGTALIPGLVSAVHFGSASAAFSVTPSGSVVATSPPGSAGTVDVTVTTAAGTSPITGGDRFTYVGSAQPNVPGYDLVGSDGGVFVFPTGNAGGFYGSLPGLGVTPVKPIVGMVPTSNDQGYFLVGADGGVFSFGNAPFLGSLPGLGVVPAQPITGIVPTGTDGGYFLVGKDGGVYAFGNAPFLGSLPGSGVHTSSVVGIAATPSGNGYWLVTTTGTVFAFGAAKQLGSATGAGSAVTAIAGTPTGGGYWIVTQNGSVDAFGNARFFGSLPGIGVNPVKPVIGVVHTSGTGGYWLIGSDGGVFAFGNAGFVGSLPGLGVHVSDIVGAVPTGS